MDKGQGQETQNMVDIWDFDHTKFTTPTEAPKGEEAEEVVVEGEGGVEEVEQETIVEPDGGATPPKEKGVGKQAEEEEEEEVEQTSKSKEDAPTAGADEPTGFESLFEELVNEGAVEFDPEKEYEPTTKGLKDLINETAEKRSKLAVEEYLNKLPGDAKKLVDILEKGGSVEDYVSMSNQIDFSKVPLEDKDGNPLERNQMHLVEDWMKIQGYEEDEIEKRLAKFKEAGLLTEEAEIAKKKLSAWQQKENESLIARKELEKNQKEQQRTQEAEKFKNTVLGTTEIAGFKITKTQAEKLYDYITKPNKEGKTQFQADDNEQNRLLYAYFAMNKFNKEALSKEIATKQAIKLKKGLSQFKDKEVTPKRGAADVRRTQTEEVVKNINWIV